LKIKPNCDWLHNQKVEIKIKMNDALSAPNNNNKKKQGPPRFLLQARHVSLIHQYLTLFLFVIFYPLELNCFYLNIDLYLPFYFLKK